MGRLFAFSLVLAIVYLARRAGCERSELGKADAACRE